MSRLQFIALLTPAIGSFVLVILAWLHSNTRTSDLRDSLNAKIDSINARIDDLRTEMNRQFAETSRRLGLIEADQKQFYTVTGKLDGRIDEISRR